MELATVIGDRIDAASILGNSPFYQLNEATATLDLDFHSTAAGTICHCRQQDPPWKFVRSFPLQDGESLAHLNNISGAVFGGDRLHLAVQLAPQAAVQLTTTGATRVYRQRRTGETSKLTSHFSLASDSVLDYLPDPVIPFADADLDQRTEFELATGAALFYGEIVTAGRLGRGECFAYSRLRSTLSVRAMGRRILHDRLQLTPANISVGSSTALGGYPYLVTFLALRAGAEEKEVLALQEELLAILQVNNDSRSLRPDELWGITRLPAYGLMVRGVATHSPLLLPRLRQLLAICKPRLCGRRATPPRKTY